MNELKAYKKRFIIVVCRTDRRSMKAAVLLTKAGFADVAVLRGGMEQWNHISLPADRIV